MWLPWRGRRSEPPPQNEAKDQLLDMADRLMGLSKESTALARRVETELASEGREAG